MRLGRQLELLEADREGRIKAARLLWRAKRLDGPDRTCLRGGRDTAATPERRSLHDLLHEEGLVSREQLQAALEKKHEKGGFLEQALVDMGLIDEQTILKLQANRAGMEVVELEGMEIPQDVARRVSPTIARTCEMVPVRLERGTLTVVMAYPLNVNALDDLRFMLGCTVIGAVATRDAVLKTMGRLQGPRPGAEDRGPWPTASCGSSGRSGRGNQAPPGGSAGSALTRPRRRS